MFNYMQCSEENGYLIFFLNL